MRLSLRISLSYMLPPLLRATLAAGAEPPLFELRYGDRVVFLGGKFMEREQAHSQRCGSTLQDERRGPLRQERIASFECAGPSRRREMKRVERSD